MITGMEKISFALEDNEGSCILILSLAKNKKPFNFLKGFYPISFFDDYLAIFTALVSLITVTLTCPG